MRKKKIIAAYTGLLMLMINQVCAQPATLMLPKIIEKNGHYAFLVDGKPFFMLGGQAHNSSAWPGMLPQLWTAVEAMHLNTLEVPLYWEQIEPQPGKFDFSVVNTLLVQARTHQVRLVLLWFGTWKNGSNHYMPQWMKQQSAKYPNVTGKNGEPVDSPSPLSEAALNADKKAFAAVMGYIKAADPLHTVIMVQVENEPGAWGSVRDYSPAAQKAFDGPVPAELLKPALLTSLHVPVVNEGSWPQVFGDRADEYFQAWHVAYYIGQVAAAGKAVYGLPLYVNVALREPFGNPSATSYESGGATDNVIPIWKIAAPAVDLLAPDIYLSEHEKIMKVIDLYDRPGNPLFVPECADNAGMAKYMYEVIARGGLGFSPFGIDDNGEGHSNAQTAERLAPFAREYAMIAPMMPELAGWAYAGKIKAVIEPENHAEQTVDMGAWQAIVSFGSGWRNTPPSAGSPAHGKIMIVQLAENKFVLIGSACRITFKPVGSNVGKAWQYLRVEEGTFKNGLFKMLRIRNGDETDFGGPRFGAAPAILVATLGLR